MSTPPSILGKTKLSHCDSPLPQNISCPLPPATLAASLRLGIRGCTKPAGKPIQPKSRSFPKTLATEDWEQDQNPVEGKARHSQPGPADGQGHDSQHLVWLQLLWSRRLETRFSSSTIPSMLFHQRSHLPDNGARRGVGGVIQRLLLLAIPSFLSQ